MQPEVDAQFLKTNYQPLHNNVCEAGVLAAAL